MPNQLVSFDQMGGLPVHLQGFNSGTSKDLALGGAGRNRLGLKGSRFRLIVGGQEEAILEQSTLDVIIVGAAPGVSRLYFEGNFDEDTKTRPACYSADGVSPAADVLNPQSVKCANCPQNQKGSKITASGDKTKACGYLKRMAVILADERVEDPNHRLFQLDGKAMTIFGDGEPAQNKFTLSEYAKKLQSRGVDVATVVTRLSFDIASSVPKLYFSVLRYITVDEAAIVQDLIASDEVKLITTITAITDTSDTLSEEPARSPQATPAAAPQPAPSPAPAAPSPAAKPAATIIRNVTIATKTTPTPSVAPTPAPQVAQKSQPQVNETVGDKELDDFLAQLNDMSGA